MTTETRAGTAGRPSPDYASLQRAAASRFSDNVRRIEQAATARGVRLMRNEAIVGTVEARELVRTLKAAHEKARGRPALVAHVEQLAAGIARGLGDRGAVPVRFVAHEILKRYAAGAQ